MCGGRRKEDMSVRETGRCVGGSGDTEAGREKVQVPVAGVTTVRECVGRAGRTAETLVQGQQLSSNRINLFVFHQHLSFSS